MSLTNPTDIITERRLSEFYQAILPYLGGGGSGGGGHTIEDSTGTSMTARSNLQFTGTTTVTDDNTNDATIVSVPPMPSADISSIVSPLPGTHGNRVKYSTSEQVIGEWIDGKPLYQKTLSAPISSVGSGRVWTNVILVSDLNIDRFVDYRCIYTEDSKQKIMPFSDQYYASLTYDSTSKYIQMISYGDVYAQTLYVTIWYTKTTDVAPT